MSQWSTSVVVVPSGFPLRCLRRDMVTDLVFEVWIMVSQGPSTLPPTRAGGEEGAGGGSEGQFFKISTMSPMNTMVAAHALYMV